jgi:hypothetical protein
LSVQTATLFVTSAFQRCAIVTLLVFAHMSPSGFTFALAGGTESGSHSLFLRVTLSHHLANVTADRLAAGTFF